MKTVLFAFAVTLAVGVGAQAQQMSSTAAEQAQKFSAANTPQQKEFTGDTSGLSTDLLDMQNDDAAFRGGGGRPGGGGFAPHPGGGFGPRPGVGPRPGPSFGPRPGVGPRPGFGAPRPGFGGPRPGWTPAFRWNRSWRPGWFRPGIIPAFIWAADVVAGEWQCTAYNANLAPITDVGVTQDQAAYNALYACGGADYEAAGCYIPDGYCQVR